MDIGKSQRKKEGARVTFQISKDILYNIMSKKSKVNGYVW